MDFPSDLYYTENHEWIRPDEDGATATVGITDFAQHELGDIVFVELVPTGASLERNDVFGTVEAVKTVSELYMPVSGEIVEANAELETSPELVNDDPYGGGWMVKIKMTNPDEVNQLQEADAYSAMVE